MKTKIEREWEQYKPTFEARKKIEDIKEIVDFGKYYDDLIEGLENEPE
jgi:hypothetical protein